MPGEMKLIFHVKVFMIFYNYDECIYNQKYVNSDEENWRRAKTVACHTHFIEKVNDFF